MRLAIGAGRPRLIRQLLTESLLLAAAGGIAGVAIGYLPIALARQIQLPGNPPLTLPFEFNQRVFLFGIAVAFLSVILFGLVPAFRATRTDLMSVMKGAGNVSPHRGWARKLLRGRNILVAGQVAISVLLLTVTTVLYVSAYKSLVASFHNPGFEVDHLLGMEFDRSTVHYKDARADEFFRQLTERARAGKGVKSAALVYQDVAMIRPESPLAHDDVKTAGVWIDEEFFQTLGVPLLEGRTFRKADLGATSSVAVVNDVLARHYWPDQSGVGKRVRLGAGQWLDVIGVVKMKGFMTFGTPPMDTIFLPSGVSKQRDVVLMIRSAGDPYGPVVPLEAAVRELDPDQAVPKPETWQSTYGVFTRLLRLTMNTLGLMGVLGLLLSLVGLYGLLAYDVGARTREIGIRMALGARAGAVVRMVLRQGVALAICGVGAGVTLNYGLVKVLEASVGGGAAPVAPEPNGGAQISLQAGSMYFGGAEFAALVIAVLVVTILAAYLPARRAAHVDPNVALRSE